VEVFPVIQNRTKKKEEEEEVKEKDVENEGEGEDREGEGEDVLPGYDDVPSKKKNQKVGIVKIMQRIKGTVSRDFRPSVFFGKFVFAEIFDFRIRLRAVPHSAEAILSY
jgi:hypothetical protein